MSECKICQTKIKASQLKFFVSVSGKTEHRRNCKLDEKFEI